MKVKLRGIRISFAKSLFVPREDAKGKLKYSVCALLDPKTKEGKESIARLEDALDAVAKEKWGAKVPPTARKLRIHDGDEKLNDSGDVLEGFAGMKYFNAYNEKKPDLRDGHLKVEGDQSSCSIKSGDYGTLFVNLWAMDDANYGKKINFSLLGFQKLRNGESLGGSDPTISEDEWDEPEESDDENDPLLN